MTALESIAVRQLSLASQAISAAAHAVQSSDVASARLHVAAAADWCATVKKTLDELAEKCANKLAADRPKAKIREDE